MKAKILYSELRRLVDATKEFVAQSYPECILNYIRMEFRSEDNKVRVSACDRYKLSVEWGKCKDIDEDFAAYIKPSAMKTLGLHAWYGDVVEISVSGNVTEVKVQTVTLGYDTGGMEAFIDVDKAVPEDNPVFRVAFNPRYMLALLNAELAANSEKRSPIEMEFYGNGKSLVFRSNGQKPENIRLLMPVRTRRCEEAASAKGEASAQLECAVELAKKLVDVCKDSDILGLDFENGLHITDRLFAKIIPSDCVTTKWESGAYPYLHKAVWHGCPVRCVSYKENLYEQKEVN